MSITSCSWKLFLALTLDNKSSKFMHVSVAILPSQTNLQFDLDYNWLGFLLPNIVSNTI